MVRAKLIYDLPDDTHAFTCAVHGQDLLFCLQKILSRLRQEDGDELFSRGIKAAQEIVLDEIDVYNLNDVVEL